MVSYKGCLLVKHNDIRTSNNSQNKYADWYYWNIKCFIFLYCWQNAIPLRREIKHVKKLFMELSRNQNCFNDKCTIKSQNSRMTRCFAFMVALSQLWSPWWGGLVFFHGLVLSKYNNYYAFFKDCIYSSPIWKHSCKKLSKFHFTLKNQ